MTYLATALLFGIIAGFILERRLLLNDMRTERKEWTRERSELLNRIKPETAQVVDNGPVEVPESPQWDNDREYWEQRGVEIS